MSKTIPQQKVVSKNGKSFVQTFHVNPDNASSAATSRAAGLNPQINQSTDFDIPSDVAHALKNTHDGRYVKNVEDFVNGFQQSRDFSGDKPREALEQYLNDNDPDEVHQIDFLNGFRSGLVAKLGENRDNYLTRGARFSTDHHTGDVKGGDYSQKVIPHNPFEQGDKVVIPAGTPYTTSEPGKAGVQTTQRAKTITVYNSYSGSSDAAVGWLTVRMPSIVATGTGGYWKDYSVTPDIIEANGKELLPGDLGDYAESAFRGSRY